MGVIANQKFEQRKIDRLADHLKHYQEKGKPIDFEIIVDGFKVVRRTSDLDMFTLYENYVDADTRNIEFIFYSGSSNNNDKHIFVFGEVPKAATLEGVVDVETQVSTTVNQQLMLNAFDKLKVDYAERVAEIDTLTKEVEQLEKENEELQASKSPLHSVLGEFGSSLVEAFIRRNPKVMSSIPGGQALAGLLENDTPVKDELPEDAAVSFRPSTNSEPATPVLSEEDQHAILFVNQLKAQFTKAEFGKIVLILQAMVDRQKLEQVLHQLNIKL